MEELSQAFLDMITTGGPVLLYFAATLIFIVGLGYLGWKQVADPERGGNALASDFMRVVIVVALVAASGGVIQLVQSISA